MYIDDFFINFCLLFLPFQSFSANHPTASRRSPKRLWLRPAVWSRTGPTKSRSGCRAASCRSPSMVAPSRRLIRTCVSCCHVFFCFFWGDFFCYFYFSIFSSFSKSIRSLLHGEQRPRAATRADYFIRDVPLAHQRAQQAARWLGHLR